MHCLHLSFVLALVLSPSVLAGLPAKRSYDTHDYYVLEHNPAGPTSLDDVSRMLGVDVIEQAGELLDHWLVRVQKTSIEARDDEPQDLVLDTFHNLKVRAGIERRSEDAEARNFADSVKYLSRQIPRQRVKRAPPPIRPPDIDTTARGVAQRLGIQDPMFPQQWHLVNDEFPVHMMNVTSVWEMGLTGKGIISSLVDDGLDYTSVDLKDNFVRLYAFTKPSH